MIKIKDEDRRLYSDLYDWEGDFQYVITLEELSELQKAITKFLRARQKNKLNKRHINDIAEEVADVLICTEQIMTYLKLEKRVAFHKGKKLKRINKLVAHSQKNFGKALDRRWEIK